MRLFGSQEYENILHLVLAEFEADLVGTDDESDHFRLPLFSEEARVASEDKIALASEDAITAELRIHTASSTIWRTPRFSNAEHST